MSIASDLAGALSKGGVKSDAAPEYGLFLSTGVPNVDKAISGHYRGGGFRSGRVIEIAGPPSAGKTLLASSCMVAAQKAGGAAAFHDHERTFDQNLAVGFGLDVSEGVWTYKRPRSFEDSIDKAIDWMQSIRDAKVIPFEAPLVCVFDSLAAMVPAEKLDRKPGKDGEMGAANMRQKVSLSVATSQELPAFNTYVEENNILAIFLNQIRTKPGVAFGDPRYTPGGDSMDFYASARVWLRANKLKKAADDLSSPGQLVTAETVKNKTYRAWLQAEFIFKYRDDGSGYIDVVDTMIGHLLALGKLETAGAYIIWEGKKMYRPGLLLLLNQDVAKSIEMLTDLAEA
jgi:recombination protein RecA